MTTQSIGSNLLSGTYTLLRAAVEEKQLYQNAADLDKKNSSSSTLSSEIQTYLAKIPKGDDNKLSFQDVEDYREELGDKWDAAVMADLKALGVDISQEFVMTYDPDTGKVSVPDNTKGKEIIDKYFEDNPDKVEEFQTIIQLGKLTSTASTQLSQDNLMTSMQQQSLAWWYADNTDPSSWFDGGGLLSFGTGSTSFAGLNLKV
ncbi:MULTISPECIES: hypothetical protein [unclassified Pseudodesulfovibrio]|uniref:hypothetical protein n=1 Tax=unclassified Pseudodesulfovibrio TaxID=2661612 RepID=UPI000FEB76F2|nr:MULTISPECIES: hypothetical protein [unclassified Pseudodesulfovibrio]MCJ2164328.1 hypothetical protein [Pseudodesulfovibrio sp. S3-i]RWU04538.1 hypothetical protein DWB63_07215 [Pseudodesulfovibrio sp. S3]